MHHHPSNFLSVFHGVRFLSSFLVGSLLSEARGVVGACLVLHLASPCPQHNGGPPTKVYFFPREIKIKIKKNPTAPGLSSTEQVLRITMEMHAARDVKGPESVQ